jgi:hypothetical protein
LSDFRGACFWRRIEVLGFTFEESSDAVSAR